MLWVLIRSASAFFYGEIRQILELFDWKSALSGAVVNVMFSEKMIQLLRQ